MNNLEVFCPARGRMVGTILLGLCSFVPLSQASVVVNNTGNADPSTYDGGGVPVAQVFTMPSSYSGTISSLSLTMGLGSGGSIVSEVYVYDTSSGAPNSSLYDLGSVTAVSGVANVNLNSLNDSLTAGDTYAIVVDSSADAYWTESTTGGSGGDGTLGGAYYNFGGWTSEGDGVYFGMDLQVSPVPEVPVTGVVMGFGALTIGVGHTLRRKFALPSLASLKL